MTRIVEGEACGVAVPAERRMGNVGGFMRAQCEVLRLGLVIKETIMAVFMKCVLYEKVVKQRLHEAHSAMWDQFFLHECHVGLMKRLFSPISLPLSEGLKVEQNIKIVFK